MLGLGSLRFVLFDILSGLFLELVIGVIVLEEHFVGYAAQFVAECDHLAIIDMLVLEALQLFKIRLALTVIVAHIIDVAPIVLEVFYDSLFIVREFMVAEFLQNLEPLIYILLDDCRVYCPLYIFRLLGFILLFST